MTNEENRKNTSPSDNESDGQDKPTPVMSDYLQAPKKKRKSFVVIAPGPNLDADGLVAIQKFISTQYPKLTIVVAKNLDELTKYASKNVMLALIDDEFNGRDQTLSAARLLKEKKSDGPLPTVFLTQDPPALIAEYQKHLPVWHEVDDYLVVGETSRQAMFSMLKSAIENRNQRRARRFKVNIPIIFQALDSGETRFQGDILDFSIHGALISVSNDAHRFSIKDQLVIHVPISQFLKGKPDVFRVSARVRRVLISGDKAGISWEHLTEEKVATLTELLTHIIDVSLSKAAASARQRYGKYLEEPEAASSKPK